MAYIFKLQVVSNVGVVTEGTTLVIITQVSSGFKNCIGQVLQIQVPSC